MRECVLDSNILNEGKEEKKEIDKIWIDDTRLYSSKALFFLAIFHLISK